MVEGVGGRLIEARGSANQKAFAQLLGVHVNTYARWERNEAECGVGALARLYQLGINPTWIATGHGQMQLADEERLASQAGRLDEATIASALKLLKWAFELQGARYDPLEDPDLLVDTYAFLAEHEGSVTPDNLVDFSKRLAEKRAKEADRVTREQGAGGAEPGEGDPRKGAG